MGWNNFEHHVKEKLEARRMPPSDELWDKLDARLSENTQKSRKTYWWIGIAASFLLGLLISGIYFSGRFFSEDSGLVRGSDPVPTVETAIPDGKKSDRIHKTDKNGGMDDRLVVPDLPPGIRLKDSPKIAKSRPIPAEKHSREKTTKTAVSDMVLSQTDSVHQKPSEDDFEKPEDSGDLNTAI